MIHEQEKVSVAQLQPNNQALIWDLIKGSQHEEAALTKKMKNPLSQRVFHRVFSNANAFHLTAVLKGHKPQFGSV